MGKKRKKNRQNNNPAPAENYSVPLPEYEENSLSARKANLLSEVSREMNGKAEAEEEALPVEAAREEEIAAVPEQEYAPAEEERPSSFFGGEEKIPASSHLEYEEKEEGGLREEELFSLEEEEELYSADGQPVRERRNPPARKKRRELSFGEWFGQYKRVLIPGLAAAVLLIIAIVVFGNMQGKKPDGGSASLSANERSVTDQVASISDDETGSMEEPLTESEDPELTGFIARYFKAREENDIETYRMMRSFTDSLEQAKLEAKSEYIEAYRNLHCYTKKGPYDNSWMVYVSYDLKLKEWEQTAPALETLVVCRKEVPEGSETPGELYVYSGSFDENVVEYIRTVTAQQDVVDLFKHVDTQYQEVMDADPEYEEYMSSLKQLIRDGVGVRLAAAAEGNDVSDGSTAKEEPTPTPEEKEGEENTEEEEEEEIVAAAPVEFEVEATNYVNVRASDSQNADRLGSVNPGTKLTCKEQLANGWSHVIFEGKDAYIKSDYLAVVGGSDVKTQGKVQATSTVNIRAKADTNSDILGTAYSGTSFDLVEETEGWTKILYNGKEAYIKSDYVKKL
ncbi:MAG: SH3 domain-containing protein [Lachnospiraceae bacterium]|nr:SH3 domain-containing protein [Lachnospiraceae bacterium]